MEAELGMCGENYLNLYLRETIVFKVNLDCFPQFIISMKFPWMVRCLIKVSTNPDNYDLTFKEKKMVMVMIVRAKQYYPIVTIIVAI